MDSNLPFVAAMPISSGLEAVGQTTLASLASAAVRITSVEHDIQLGDGWEASMVFNVEEERPAKALEVGAWTSKWDGSYLVVR